MIGFKYAYLFTGQMDLPYVTRRSPAGRPIQPAMQLYRYAEVQLCPPN